MQGLYGRNDKGAIAIAKPDPALIAVLINREHSRLSSQVKTLEKVLHAPFSGLHGTPTFKNVSAQKGVPK